MMNENGFETEFDGHRKPKSDRADALAAIGKGAMFLTNV